MPKLSQRFEAEGFHGGTENDPKALGAVPPVPRKHPRERDRLPSPGERPGGGGRRGPSSPAFNCFSPQTRPAAHLAGRRGPPTPLTLLSPSRAGSGGASTGTHRPFPVSKPVGRGAGPQLRPPVCVCQGAGVGIASARCGRESGARRGRAGQGARPCPVRGGGGGRWRPGGPLRSASARLRPRRLRPLLPAPPLSPPSRAASSFSSLLLLLLLLLLPGEGSGSGCPG